MKQVPLRDKTDLIVNGLAFGMELATETNATFSPCCAYEALKLGISSIGPGS